MPSTDTGMYGAKKQVWGMDIGLGFGNTKFEMPIRPSSGDV